MQSKLIKESFYYFANGMDFKWHNKSSGSYLKYEGEVYGYTEANFGSQYILMSSYTFISVQI